jgi:probable 2-oxoglutarate dehydrogenase E1 component DHKTD1
MVHNPSHLEAQNPVSMGKARSKIHLYGIDKVLNIQVHGDAAICAQGIVY